MNNKLGKNELCVDSDEQLKLMIRLIRKLGNKTRYRVEE